MYTMTKYNMYSSVILGTCYIRIQVEDIYSCTPSAPLLFLIATTNNANWNHTMSYVALHCTANS